MDSKRYLRFTAGFIFNDDYEAKIEWVGDNITIYLNPYLIKISWEYRYVIMEDLKDLAIHELAHLRVKDHNEDFVNEMASIRKITSRADQRPYINIRQIRA
jgi:predicted metal-dependent hydrolase